MLAVVTSRRNDAREALGRELVLVVRNDNVAGASHGCSLTTR
jgi:hypothetical protein